MNTPHPTASPRSRWFLSRPCLVSIEPQAQQRARAARLSAHLPGWLAAVSLSLAACGGGGSGGAIDGGTGGGPADTPMQTLVAPESMNWETTQPQRLQLSVLREPDGVAVPDAVVSLFSFTRSGPNSAEPLAEPVPQALLETGSTGADGRLSFSSRVPAHLTEVLLVVSSGATSVSQVVAASQLHQALTVRLAP